MIIELIRKRINGATCDGVLKIDGQRVCGTAENASHRLPPGLYYVEIREDKQANRKLPTLISGEVHRGRFPTIRPGNGIHTLTHGEILVGDHLVPGVVIHSRDTFDLLYQRLYRAISREKTIRLFVNE